MHHNAFGMLANALRSMELPPPDSQFDELLARIDVVAAALDRPRFASGKPVRGVDRLGGAKAAEQFS